MPELARPPSSRIASIRIDKWLWQARFFQTRSLAAEAVSAGRVRINGARVTKPAAPVRPGDGLSFAQGAHVRVIRVLGLGERRGPATEARELYLDLEEPRPAEPQGTEQGPLDPDPETVK